MPAPIEFPCDHCGASCTAPASTAGGIVNCSECNQATEVPGLRDGYWRLLKLGAALLVAWIATTVYTYHGVVIAVAVAAVLIAGLWLLSLAL